LVRTEVNDEFHQTSLIPDDAESVIAKAVQNQDIDILIMGAYSHSPLRSFFLATRHRICCNPQKSQRCYFVDATKIAGSERLRI
jgi:hypothetical protein